MSNRLIQVEKENINLAWNDARVYIEQALHLTPEYSVIDIYRYLKDGLLNLWIFYNDEKKAPFGAMVTEIIEHPQMRILSIFLLSADNFDDIAPLFTPFREYAVSVGADKIECGGRFGLERLLSDLGFKKSYIVMSFDVN